METKDPNLNALTKKQRNLLLTSASYRRFSYGCSRYPTLAVGVFLSLLVSSSLLVASTYSFEENSTLFPSEGFEEQIQFWQLMFTQYSERDLIFHDRRDLRLDLRGGAYRQKV